MQKRKKRGRRKSCHYPSTPPSLLLPLKDRANKGQKPLSLRNALIACWPLCVSLRGKNCLASRFRQGRRGLQTCSRLFGSKSENIHDRGPRGGNASGRAEWRSGEGRNRRKAYYDKAGGETRLLHFDRRTNSSLASTICLFPLAPDSLHANARAGES